MEMEAFDEGTITEIRIQEGAKAEIGGVLAVLDGAGSDASAPAQAAAPAAAEAPAAAAAAPTQVPAPQPSDGARVKASPLARKVAAELGVDLSGVTGTGPAGRIVKDDVEKASTGAARSIIGMVELLCSPSSENGARNTPALKLFTYGIS